VAPIGQNSNRLPHDFEEKSCLGAMSNVKITYKNDNFNARNRQVTPVLPILDSSEEADNSKYSISRTRYPLDE